MKSKSAKKKASIKTEAQKQRHSFGQRALAVLPVLLVSLLLTLLYSDPALFRTLETKALDFHMVVRSPQQSKNVAIVTITESDYQTEFGGKSPLDPAKLKNALEAIALSGAKVIGVDVDTSSSQFQDFTLVSGLPPVIWAREATYSNREKTYRVSNLLGQQNPQQPNGLVTLKADKDGAVRRYVRWYKTNNDPVASFPWQIVQAFRTGQSANAEIKGSEEELLIDYPGPAKSNPFAQVTFSTVMQWSKVGVSETNPLKDKIVLLGGDYASRDEHDTPVGWMLGTEVLASIIETELGGGGKKPAGIFIIVLLVIFDSLLLLLLIQVIGLWKTFALSIFAIPALAFISSYLLFGSAAYISYFLLVLTAILLHQLYEKGKEYFKKFKEQTAEKLQ